MFSTKTTNFHYLVTYNKQLQVISVKNFFSDLKTQMVNFVGKICLNLATESTNIHCLTFEGGGPLIRYRSLECD